MLIRILALALAFSISSPAWAEWVLFDKRTGKPVNDFQSKASPEDLKNNAIAAGLGNEEDFVAREVEPDQFARIEEEVNGPVREAKANERKRRAELKQSAKTKLLQGEQLTPEEIAVLVIDDGE